MLRGTRTLGEAEVCGERALLAAVVRQALEDAKRGSSEAAEWLDHVAPWWCAKLLDLDAERVRAWRGVLGGSRTPYRVRTTQAPALSSAERGRQYRARKRAAAVVAPPSPR
jgi:hypothetical protein